jgi:hypothetical protein
MKYRIALKFRTDHRPLTLALSRREKELTEVNGKAAPT